MVFTGLLKKQIAPSQQLTLSRLWLRLWGWLLTCEPIAKLAQSRDRGESSASIPNRAALLSTKSPTGGIAKSCTKTPNSEPKPGLPNEPTSVAILLKQQCL